MASEDHDFYQKVYFSFSLMHLGFLLIYTSLVIYITCKLKIRLDKFSLSIVLCFIFGFAFKFAGWLLVSIRIRYVENFLIAYSLEIMINAVFFLILDVFIFKMLNTYAVQKSNSIQEFQIANKKVQKFMYSFIILYCLTVAAIITLVVLTNSNLTVGYKRLDYILTNFNLAVCLVRLVLDLSMDILFLILFFHFKNLKRAAMLKRYKPWTCYHSLVFGVSLFIVVIYTIRIVIRDVLVPISNYKEITDQWAFFRLILDFEEIFYGITDFCTAIMILYLFYIYGQENKTRRKKNESKKHHERSDCVNEEENPDMTALMMSPSNSPFSSINPNKKRKTTKKAKKPKEVKESYHIEDSSDEEEEYSSGEEEAYQQSMHSSLANDDYFTTYLNRLQKIDASSINQF